MAVDRFVSPGVFTLENDLSFLPQGVSQIGAAIIGPTQKGPAFVPTLVQSPDDFITLFGDSYQGSYVPFTVKEYLANAGRATIVRVAGLSGYISDALGIEVSGTLQDTSSVIYLAATATGIISGTNAASWSVAGFNTLSTDFQLVSGTIRLPVSVNTSVSSMSLNQNSSSYIGTVLGASSLGTYLLYVSDSKPTTITNDLAFTTLSTGSIASVATRILASGSDVNNLPNGTLALTASATIDNAHKTFAVLVPSTSSFASVPGWINSWSITQLNTDTLSFVLSSSLATQPTSYSLSINPGDANYLPNVLGSAPGVKDFYVYSNYINRQEDLYSFIQAASVDNISIARTIYDVSLPNTGILANGGYSEAFTPWIKSQTINSQRYPLFRFWTFTAGPSPVKVSISSIRRPDQVAGFVAGVTYATFTVTVRDINDTDNAPNAIETFANVTLDPASPNYIARVIGDQFRVFGTDADGNQKVFVNGDFSNQSKYVRIEIFEGLIPVNSMPFGIDKYIEPLSFGTGGSSTLPNVHYIYTQKTTLGDFNFRTYLGFDTSYTDNLSVLTPVATGSAGQDDDSIEFNLEYCNMSNASQTAEIPFDITNDNANAINARKFTVALQGGFDGFDPTIGKNMGEDMTAANSMGFDFSTAASSGVNAYKKAIDTVANPDEFDINMMVLPGVTNDLAGSVISYANTVSENRGDVFFLFDCVTIGGQGSARTTPTNAVNSVLGIDSNYAATYYPWVKIFDNVNNKFVWVPPSVVMAGVISFNDRVAAEWWAPAGLNRGGISSAIQVATRLTQAERDLLYEGRVNPIATFVGQGIVAWGQKTLQVKASALDRINVRRLLINLKKFVASTTRFLVFEQNTVATRTRFLNIVQPYLNSVQQKQGLFAFKVVMDETNNPPDIVDRNLMVGTIFIQPTKTAEIIPITFNILPQGATFSQ